MTRPISFAEREIVALRVTPVSEQGRAFDMTQRRDAGWLVRRGARVGAIGMAVGRLIGEGQELRPCFDSVVELNSDGYPDACPEDPGVTAEAMRLRMFESYMRDAANPLIVTCGGRGLDLPLLRYRSLARGIPLASLHICTGRRFSYFDRFDYGWHVDVSDFLAGNGPSQPLELSELCGLVDLARGDVSKDPEVRAASEAAQLFELFCRLLGVIGWLAWSERKFEG